MLCGQIIPLQLRLEASCSEVDFSISIAEHLVRVGQSDQQGGTNEKGQDQAGLRKCHEWWGPAGILFLGASQTLPEG